VQGARHDRPRVRGCYISPMFSISSRRPPSYRQRRPQSTHGKLDRLHTRARAPCLRVSSELPIPAAAANAVRGSAPAAHSTVSSLKAQLTLVGGSW